jgi:23S rRNA (cytosine1962-C5)-methyltransferase
LNVSKIFIHSAIIDMTPNKRITLKPGKEYALQRFHPWVFSGALKSVPEDIREGEVVEIFSAAGDYLATAHFQQGGIALKIISFIQRPIDDRFWLEKLSAAIERRKSLGLLDQPGNNSWRLVYSEGDGLPGLIIDWYNGVAVFQSHSAGMHSVKPVLVEALKGIFGDRLTAVYDKSREAMRSSTEGGGRDAKETDITDGFLYGQCDSVEITETGHKFRVDIEKGQKTGFFLDQRSNRMFAQFYARGRKVLNAFCYSGAFSVYTLKGGATHVDSVDSSRQAVEWTKENLLLNGIPDDVHREIVEDVKHFLPSSEEKYDMVILDPPAFAKRHNVTHNALQAYIHINAEALKKLNPGGILFTFSCSQAISREMFRSAVQAAAIETGREAKVLHHLSQGPDHPVSLFHPEGEYLKGLVLLVT